MSALLQTPPDMSSCGSERVVSVEEAIAIGLGKAQPVAETELVGLHDAVGRILAQPVAANEPLPRFDYSAMDGYAVDTSSLTALSSGLNLRVSGTIAARASAGNPELQQGCAIRILTGAPIPAGADAVVAQEHVRCHNDRVILAGMPKPGDNIRKRGEDVEPGRRLIEAGTAIGALQAGVVAACGYSTVRVFRKLRVAMFTTGSELRQPGERIQAGEIYDSNRFILRSLLTTPWIEIIDLGSCLDQPSQLRTVFQAAAADADVIISAGGVSVGDEDHVVDAFRNCGGRLWVRKVAIKPGKPLVLGQMADATYVGLPGNPGALFTTFKIVVDGILRARAGMQPDGDGEGTAIANFDWNGRPGRSTYLPVVVVGSSRGLPLIELLPDANSGKLYQLSRAAGFIVIGPHTDRIVCGDDVRWRPFEG